MKVVAGVGGRQEAGGLRGIAHARVEVDHRVERTTPSDPVVDRPSRRLALFTAVLRAAERWNCGAVNPQPPRVYTIDDCAVRGEQLSRDRCRGAGLPRT